MLHKLILSYKKLSLQYNTQSFYMDENYKASKPNYEENKSINKDPIQLTFIINENKMKPLFLIWL